MKKTVVLLLLVLTLLFTALTQTDDDKKAVKQASLDYTESIYNVNPALVERSAFILI